jgi:hypothetical protein
MTKDMEMSCDERVMKQSSEDIRANYSNSLLSMSARRSGLPNPLAFGESNVKSRVKNVLNFKKRSRWIIALAAVLVVALSTGFSANRINSQNQDNESVPNAVETLESPASNDDIVLNEPGAPPPPPLPPLPSSSANTPGVVIPEGFENEIYRFISWHHGHSVFMNNNELQPEVNTLFAIWRTYALETAIGTVFEADDINFGWKIPVETVENAVSYIYDLDGNSVQYDDFYINKQTPDYFWLPSGFSADTIWAFIQLDTLNIDNNIYTFDVIFYDSPTDDDSDRGEELRRFNYKFEQVLYKDTVICYKFIEAVRVH